MSTSFAQEIVPSVTNLLRYGDGTRGLAALDESFNYFENLTDARFNFGSNLTVGFRLLYDEPPEIGPRFRGVQRRYIEFNKDNISIRAGNFSELFSRGLAVNLFENRGLAYDTWMDGVKAEYQNGPVKISAIGGALDYRDSVTIARIEHYKIISGSLEYKILKQLMIGSSYVSVDGDIPQLQSSKNIHAEIGELFLNLNLGGFNYLVDWANKWTNVITDNAIANGTGLYSSLSYAGGGLGITLDYKNYKFDERDPLEQNDFTRPTRALPIQNPPIVQKEQSYTLLTRAFHQVDFNDEVGLQLDVLYTIDGSTNISLNASTASRHDFYDLNNFQFTKKERSSNFLPSFDERLSLTAKFFSSLNITLKNKQRCAED